MLKYLVIESASIMIKKVEMRSNLLFITIISILASCSSIKTSHQSNLENVEMLVKLNVKKEHLEEFQQKLLVNKIKTKSEAGNLSLEIFNSKTEHTVFYVHSLWRDRKAMIRHNDFSYSRELYQLSEKALAAKPIVMEIYHGK